MGTIEEVAKTIERLEKLGLSIPEELRRLKVNLATQTNSHTHFENQLKMLGKNLSRALELVEATLEQSLVKQKMGKILLHIHCIDPEITAYELLIPVLKNYVFEALTELGGSAHCSEVIEKIPRVVEPIDSG